MKITVLGTGTPTPTAARFGSAFVAEVEDDVLMFDCGPAATHKLVKAGLQPTTVDRLFFTHHHYDHDADYGCLMICRWDHAVGDTPPLQVYGPTHTRTITDRLIGEDGAFAFDWRARIGHPVSQNVYRNRGGVLPRRPPEVIATDIDPGHRVDGRGWSVEASHAQHVQPFLDSLAYRLETAGATAVFTGDTEPCPEVAAAAQGADVLFAMCWDVEDRMVASGERGAQMGTRSAAALARDAGVKTLVLVHTGPHLSSPEVASGALDDVASIFPGRVVFAEEGMSLDL
jgi:ribonuclease Z